MTTTTAAPTTAHQALFGHWIHSREEDRDDVQVFRREGFAFPVSFGRDGFRVYGDGVFLQEDVGAADGIVTVPGRWSCRVPGRIAVRFGGARPDYDFEVVDVADDVLRIRVQEPLGSGRELADRRSIEAFRVADRVVLIATGELPSPGFRVDVVQSPLRIFPPRFELVRVPLPGFWPQVLTPFRYAEVVRYPVDRDVIRVHHADGVDAVRIQEPGRDLEQLAALGPATDPAGGDEATGFSAALSFDEAFRDALAGLPPLEDGGVADRMATVRVLDIAGLFGGIAGFRHLTVRVRRTVDG
ncbi:hypothetical protein [Pseudonocardia lacus]|uniref:hypothetical protein n=1 Tax=Pseudonocardia lacus TaxID=2835865 RepID=UPI001BDCB1A8|nr:hypothetical protein [Pseudonocardia lacus]